MWMNFFPIGFGTNQLELIHIYSTDCIGFEQNNQMKRQIKHEK